MSENQPPTPFPLNPIYNPNDWVPSSNTVINLEYLNTHYLKYPSAQGLENLQEVNVNGYAHFYSDASFNSNVDILGTLTAGSFSVTNFNVGNLNVATSLDCSGNVLFTDYTPASTTTALFTLAQDANHNRLAFILNPNIGAYNYLTQMNDNLLLSGDVVSGANPLTIACWNNANASGIRLTATNIVMGFGSTTPIPTNRITIDGTNMTFDAGSETAIQFNKSITMNSTTATSRQIFTGYLNLCNIASTPQSTGTQLYQNGVNSYWDNNVNGGNLTIAMNTSAGTQVTPMLINSTQTQLNLPLKLNAGSNIIFPDGTTQSTAYVASTTKVYTTIYVANQVNLFMPANVFKIDIRVVGRGGGAGLDTAYKGGSGAGGQIACITNCPLQDGYYININFVATAGATIGYTEVVDAYTLAPILRAYNGGVGGTAATAFGGSAGIASPLSGTTTPVIDSNYGTVFALAASNGSAGTLSLPPSIGVVKGSPPNVSTNYGNGQLSTQAGLNTWATGAVYITYYLK